MPANLPPQPLLTPVVQPGESGQGTLLSRIWSQWFNSIANALTSLTSRVETLEAVCPQIVSIVQRSGLTANVASTTLYAVPVTMTNGMYRVTCHNDLNLAGGKCIVSISYTCDGTSRVFDGTQVTNVNDPVSWTYLLDPDAGTIIYYYTTCVIPGGGIDYDVDLFVEWMPT